MSVLFVSDLHLDAARPEIGEQFLRFLSDDAPVAEALYILGDLFEYWVGDDDPQPEKNRIGEAIRRLSDRGLPCYFMHGNRDFLVGESFAAQAGLQLLEEETVVELYGEAVLLLHGDTLCTDDREYQAFRKTVRDKQWQRQFLAMPLKRRLAMAAEARARSRLHNAEAAAALAEAGSGDAEPVEDIMDVNQRTVAETMKRHGVTRMLHGHTHRPAVHRFELDGAPAIRIVLGDWYDQGSVLTWSADGPQLDALPR